MANNYAETMTQELAIADKLDPASNGVATYNTVGIDMQKFGRVLYELQLGAFGTGTLAVQLQSAAASGFGTPHNVGAVINLTSANNNTRVTIEALDEYINTLNQGDRYVRLNIVVGTAAVVFGVTGWGGCADQSPGNALNIASVGSQVVNQ